MPILGRHLLVRRCPLGSLQNVGYARRTKAVLATGKFPTVIAAE
jgi:hypothetical protein